MCTEDMHQVKMSIGMQDDEFVPAKFINDYLNKEPYIEVNSAAVFRLLQSFQCCNIFLFKYIIFNSRSNWEGIIWRFSISV
ncbi:hypothetical protein RLOatenuis_2310 [Rickettsiales bacterium]|nr:hypothetical protein RLOatenuis_2310 [Rickettsiales bacterium]